MQYLNTTIRHLMIFSLLLFIPNSVHAKNLIYGKIIHSFDGTPVRGLRVRAWDYDAGSRDDKMGEAITNSNGYFKIKYRKGKWDFASRRSGKWRPE